MKEMVGGCCVCSEELGWSENPLVYCDGSSCNVAVHQACYGIVQVPTGPWYCRKCETMERSTRVRCELCPQKDGAFKKTDNGGWAHVVCALYIPEVEFGDVSTMEPIVISYIPPDRFNKSCYICEERGENSKATTGACMHCNKTGCKQYFHVTCAQTSGLLCEEPGNYQGNVQYCGYCSYHYKKLRRDGTTKSIPAFQPIPADNATPNVSPEKPVIKASGSQIANNFCRRPTMTSELPVYVESNVTKPKTPCRPTSTLQQPDVNKDSMIANHDIKHDFVDVENIETVKASTPTSVGVGASFLAMSNGPSIDSSSTVTTNNSIVIQPAKLGFPNNSVKVSDSVNVNVSAGTRSSPVSLPSQGTPTTVNLTSPPTQTTLTPTTTSASEITLHMDLLSGSNQNQSANTQFLNGMIEGEKDKKKKPRRPRDPQARPRKQNLGQSQIVVTPGVKKRANKRKQESNKVLSNSLEISNPTINGPTTLLGPPLSIQSGTSDSTNSPSCNLPTSMEQLLERQWEQGSQFLMEQGQHFDIASLLGCLNQLKQENTRLEDHIRTLTSRRDHLLAVNARLSLPFTSTNTSAMPACTTNATPDVRLNHVTPVRAKEPPTIQASVPSVVNMINVSPRSLSGPKSPRGSESQSSRTNQDLTNSVTHGNTPSAINKIGQGHRVAIDKTVDSTRMPLSTNSIRGTTASPLVGQKRPDSTGSHSRSPQVPLAKKQRTSSAIKSPGSAQMNINTGVGNSTYGPSTSPRSTSASATASVYDTQQHLKLQQYQQQMMIAAQLSHEQQLMYAQIVQQQQQQQQLGVYGHQMSLSANSFPGNPNINQSNILDMSKTSGDKTRDKT